MWSVVCQCGAKVSAAPLPALLIGIPPKVKLEWGLQAGESLPRGLRMDRLTGTLIGSPAVFTPETAYHIEISEVGDDISQIHQRLLVLTVGSPAAKPCFSALCTKAISVGIGTVLTVGPTAPFLPAMDYTAGGDVETFGLTLPTDSTITGLHIDPHSGALLGRVVIDKNSALPSVLKCMVIARNERGTATFLLRIEVVLQGQKTRCLLPPVLAASIDQEGTCQHVQDPTSTFLASLPSAHVRDSVTSALEALRRGTFDFYSVRDKDIPASYDGLVFLNVSKTAATSAAPLPEEVRQGATALLLQALACLQAFAAEHRGVFVEEAVQHLAAYHSALFGPDVMHGWEPLYFLALSRVSRAADKAKHPLPPGFPDVRENLAVQSELLGIVQHTTEGWVTEEDLRAIVAFAAAPAASGPVAEDGTSSVGHTSSSAPSCAPSGAATSSPGMGRSAEKEVLVGAEKEWSAILRRPDLAGDCTSLTAAAKELFDMVGLEAVKAQAVSVYKKVAMDLKLPPPVRIGCTLNFSFMGKQP